MSAEDWIPDFDFWDYEDDGSTLCRYCNRECYWSETDRGWRLFEIGNGEQHICPKRNARKASEELVSVDD